MPADGKEHRRAGPLCGTYGGEKWNYINAIVTITIILMLGGCAPRLITREVVLAPQVSVTPINVGSGAKVYLTVLDGRPQLTLADYFCQACNAHVRASTSGDVGLVLRESFRTGLSTLGFEVLPTPEASPVSLEIQLLSLQYMPVIDKRGYFEALDIVAEAKAEIRRGRTRASQEITFEKMYRAGGRYTEFYYFTDRRGEEKTNTVLSELIGRILADLELLHALR